MELLIFYILLALVVSFFCSVMEAVLLSVTPGFLEHEVQQDKRYAKKLATLKEKIDEPLSAILTLNTIAHTMGAAGAGAQWKAVYGDTGEAIFAGVLTFAILLLSEILPKSIGAKFWRVLARPVTILLVWLVRILYVFVKMARLITRLLGGESNHSISRAELMAMANVSSRSGYLDNQETQMVHNLLQFRDFKVTDIMTPRPVVHMQPDNMLIDDFLQQELDLPFSRIPLHGKTRDDVKSFVLKSDIMASHIRGDGKKTLEELARPLAAVPNMVSIDQVFKQLMNNHQHLALVVDEFGGMVGLVTLEDVVETLLGLEIVDEADRTPDMQLLARKLWQKRATQMGIQWQTDPDNEIQH